MKQITGDFDIKIARNYADLINKCSSGEINFEERSGAEGVVIFCGDHAIKHPYPGDSKIFNGRLNGLINEFNIGKGLEDIGVNVPKMHGVYVRDDEMPFLIMGRLNITDFEKLSRKERQEAIKQYAEQRVIAESAGYAPGDVNYETNCGFGRKQNKLFFYDFTDWRKN